MDKRIIFIAECYGLADRLLKMIEETSELQTEIAKYLNDPTDERRAKLNEELEDVYVVGDQIRHLGFGDQEVRDHKLNRTMERMDDE